MAGRRNCPASPESDAGYVPGHGRLASAGAEHKSLLLLFFRKEELSSQ
jgi:hypothetical protein